MNTLTVSLPAGYISEGGRVNQAVIKMPTTQSILSARSKMGEHVDPTLTLDIMRNVFVGFEEDTKLKVNPTDLYHCDANWIFRELALWELREMGETPAVVRECGECGQKGTFVLDLEGQDVRWFEDTLYAKSDDMTLPFTLRTPITSLDVDETPFSEGKLTLITLGEEVQRMKLLRKSSLRYQTEGLKMMFAEIGPKQKPDISSADVAKLDVLDLKRLEKLYDQNEPGERRLGKHVCPNCGAETDLFPPVIWMVDFLLFTRSE